MLSKAEQYGFWPTAIGGFILGVLTVLLVLLLAKRTGNDEPPTRIPGGEPPAQSSQPVP